MTRSNYKTERVNELNWLMNVESYPTEIENKEWVEVINFNSEWNKLVSSYWMVEKYNLSLDWEVTWILVDDEDIYFTHWWKLYKNNVEVLSWLPDKRTYISLWDTYIFFTFDTWDEVPKYWDWATLSDKTWLWTPKYNIIYNWKWILGWYWNDNLYFSKTGSPTTPADILDFTTYSAWAQSVWWNWTWRITWFITWENWLYVFKNDEVWYSNTEKDTWVDFNFIFNKITSVWAVWQRAITQVDQEVFFFDWKAVRRLSYEQNLTTLRDVAVSRKIEDKFKELKSDQSWAIMYYKYPNVKLWLQSTLVWWDTKDILYTYNIDWKWWLTEYNKDCTVWHKWFIWSAYECIIYEDDKWTAILWWPIEWVFKSKHYTLWDSVDYKRFGGFEIVWSIDETMSLNVQIIVDNEEADNFDITADKSVFPTFWTKVLWAKTLWWDWPQYTLVPFKEKIDLFEDGQYIQIILSFTGIGRVEVSNFNFEYKPLKVYFAYA